MAPKSKGQKAPTVPKSHLLSAAGRVWAEMKDEFEPPAVKDAAVGSPGGGYDAAAPADVAAEEPAVSAEEMKKITKLLQHVVTKFGASASVADESDFEGLKPIATEVIHAYTAALGTLLSLKRGAGACLLAELKAVGFGLASSVEAMGAAAGTTSLAMNAGKVLTSAKQFEKVSTTSRASIRRRLLRSLAQLRDAKREVTQALAEEAKGEDEEDFDDFDELGSDGGVDDDEKRVLGAIGALCDQLVPTFEEASKACAVAAARPRPLLEVAVVHASAAADAVDTITAGVSAGIEKDDCLKCLETLSNAADGLRCATGSADPNDKVTEALKELREAIDAVYAANED